MATRSSKLTGSAGGVLSYLKDEEATLRYYDAEEGFSQAWGKLAKSWGLERGVTREQFVRMFNGQHPHTGEQLAKSGYKKIIRADGTVETVAARTGAIDIVYGVPKSLSVLYVQATPEFRKKLDGVVLNAAHVTTERCVEAVAKVARVPVKTPTQVGARTTKQQGSETERVTADTITFPTVQYSSRPTEESLERGDPGVDPQVHVHCTMATLCFVDGRPYTADEYGIKNKTNAKFRDATFLGEVARGLEELGVTLKYNEFERARAGEVRWEIDGVDPKLCRHWSTNNERAWRLRIEYELKHDRPIDEVKLNDILYKTRKHKTPAVKRQDSHPNWNLWLNDARRAGFPLGHYIPERPIEHNAFRAADTLRLRLLSANGLCRDDAVFDEASIRPAIARCAVGLGFSPAELDGCARAMLAPDGRDLVLVRDANDPEHRLYTTRTILAAEHDIADERDRKAGHWVDITGKAGTGKSRLTATAVEALRSLDGAPIAEAVKATLDRQDVKLDDEQVAGVHAIVQAAKGCTEVICVSMAASTAERTGQKIKADAWGSVESVVSRIDRKNIKPTARTLVVIEEAGQLDTLRMHKLLKAVGDARIVTLGDTRQLAAIGGAGWYADALDRHGSIELTEVRRQKDQRDVNDYALVRDGRAAEALRGLDERGRVHVSLTDADRIGSVFADYQSLRGGGRLARDIRIVLDSSNADVDTVNRFVQRDRIERREISPRGIEVESEEQGRRWRLHENDQVIMLSTTRVRGEDPVKNGTMGVVRRIDEQRNRVRIRLDDGHEVNLPANAGIGLGYACHISKMQGGETPIALVVPGVQSSRNSGYTLLTRGIEESHVYVSNERGGLQALGEAWQRVDEKESARTAIERIRSEQAIEELPPVRSDEITFDDIHLDPLPALDTIEELPPLVRVRMEDTFTPERFVPESLEVSLDVEGLDRGMEI